MGRSPGTPLLVATGLIAIAGAGSPRPAFEVASVKPFQGLGTNVRLDISGPRVTITQYGLLGLIMTAYHVEGWQVYGGPDWRDSQLFNIVANAPGERAPTMEQVRQMLQTLLADRFRLKVHREKKQSPVYALVVAKNGPKLKASTAYQPSYSLGGRGRTVQLISQKTTMEYFALQLSNTGQTGREVVDKTGLTGSYDFELNWASENDGGPSLDSNVPDLFTALQEQLGLKLESRKAFVETLVVDHAEKPSPN